MPTCRTISHCDIYWVIYWSFKGDPRASSSPCSHRENLSSCLQGELIQNQQSSAAQEDTTRAAWQWGEEHVLWVVLWERKNMEMLDVLQTPIPVMHFTVARAKIFLLLKRVIAVSPHTILGLSKAMTKIRLSKPPSTTEMSLGFNPGH